MARNTLSAADVVSYFRTHAVDGTLYNCAPEPVTRNGDGEITDTPVATLAEMKDGSGTDKVIAHIRAQSGGSESSSAKAVARHFLLTREHADGPWQVSDSKDTDNKMSSKRSARAGFETAAAFDYPEHDTLVLSVVESAAGVSIVGADSAEDVLALLGAQA